MKIKFVISVVLVMFVFVVLANDDIRIKASLCLSMAQDIKVSETDFKKSLQALKALCKTVDEKKYFDEISLLAEAKYNSRPLITAVTNFTCEDAALAVSVKTAAISEVLETSLDESFSKVTRKDIDKAIEELNLQNSDLFEKSASVKLGSFIGAQYIICGNIQKLGDEIAITARVIEVKTGKIIKDGLIKVKGTGEIADAIPSLASQLSIRSKQTGNTTLSSYAIKYLNSANKRIFAEDFKAASADIMHCDMFLNGGIIKNSLITLQTSLTASTCHLSKRDYKSSTVELQKSLDFAKDVFGETDEVVIHYYYSLAKNHFQNGDLEKAMATYQDACKLFERTKEAQNGGLIPFGGLEEIISKRIRKEKFMYDKNSFEQGNNNFILKNFNLKTSAKIGFIDGL